MAGSLVQGPQGKKDKTRRQVLVKMDKEGHLKKDFGVGWGSEEITKHDKYIIKTQRRSHNSESGGNKKPEIRITKKNLCRYW